MTPNPTSAPAPHEQLERAKKWLKAEHYPDVQIEYPTTDGFVETCSLSMIIAVYAKADRFRLSEEAEQEARDIPLKCGTESNFAWNARNQNKLRMQKVAAWLREKAQ